MRTILLGLVAVCLVTNCGGGSGRSDTQNQNQPTNNPPVVNAGADQMVNEGVTVTLSAAATDADGNSLTYTCLLYTSDAADD